MIKICAEDNIKNKKYWLGILTMVLIFGMAVIGHAEGITSVYKGTFTITGIPAEFNGKFIAAEGDLEDLVLLGAQNLNLDLGTAVASVISNGRADIPMWLLYPHGYLASYFGNDTVEELGVVIFSRQNLILYENDAFIRKWV